MLSLRRNVDVRDLENDNIVMAGKNNEKKNVNGKNNENSNACGRNTAPTTRSRTALGLLSNVPGVRPVRQRPPEPIKKNVTVRKGKTVVEEKMEVEEEVEQPDTQLMTLKRILEDPDKDDGVNILLASQYVKHIMDYLLVLEGRLPLRPDFMKDAADGEITERFRMILLDWMVQVQIRYNLLPETLYLSVALLDRYLQTKGGRLKKDNLQLLGVTAMFLASKYEEMYPPDITDFVFITDNTYSARDIRLMEIDLLEQVNFFLGFPLPISFLRRYSKVAKVSAKVHALAKYFIELSMLDTSLAHMRASVCAAASLYLSMSLLGDDRVIPRHWPAVLQVYSGYYTEDLHSVITPLARLVMKQGLQSRYRSVKSKYSGDKMQNVSSLSVLSGEVMKTWANGDHSSE